MCDIEGRRKSWISLGKANDNKGEAAGSWGGRQAAEGHVSRRKRPASNFGICLVTPGGGVNVLQSAGEIERPHAAGGWIIGRDMAQCERWPKLPLEDPRKDDQELTPEFPIHGGPLCYQQKKR